MSEIFSSKKTLKKTKKNDNRILLVILLKMRILYRNYEEEKN